MKSLVVELLGARGVGKSTLARLLLAELRKRNLAAEPTLSPGIGNKIARQLITLVDRGRFTYTSLSWRPQTARHLKTFRKRYRRLRLGATGKLDRSGIQLVDEGVFQLIMELHAKTAQKDIWKIADHMANLAAFPDVVVVVEDTEAAIEQRRRMRGNAGDTLRPRVASWERSALHHTKGLLTELAASGAGPEVLTIRNGDPRRLMRATSELADGLAHHYRQLSGKPGSEHQPVVPGRRSLTST